MFWTILVHHQEQLLSCTSRLVYADTSVCCVVTATQQTDVRYRHIPNAIYNLKVAPDDGLI